MKSTTALIVTTLALSTVATNRAHPQTVEETELYENIYGYTKNVTQGWHAGTKLLSWPN
jgi:hypothetical protein